MSPSVVWRSSRAALISPFKAFLPTAMARPAALLTPSSLAASSHWRYDSDSSLGRPVGLRTSPGWIRQGLPGWKALPRGLPLSLGFALLDALFLRLDLAGLRGAIGYVHGHHGTLIRPVMISHRM